MPALAPGQVYVPESAAELREDFLTDFRLAARLAGVTEPESSVAPGTDNWFFATAVSNAGMLQYANLANMRPGLTPLTATGEDLEDWRKALGLPVVEPSPAAGKITCGVNPGVTISVPDGQQYILPNGLRGRVSGTHPSVADGDDVSVIAIDTGVQTNAESGTVIRWVSPPFGLKTEARVSDSEPLEGGFDEETEPRKRERILNRLGTSAGGGNWGQLREITFNRLPSVQDCYVYPALGGPASEKVVVIRAFDPSRNDYRRAMRDAAVALVRDAIHKSNSGSIEIPVQTVGEDESDVAISVSIPSSSLAGGNGLGWLDQSPWPPDTGYSGYVYVSAVTDADTITVSSATSVAPIAGLHHIAWWAPGEQRFYTRLITEASGGSLAWVLTLDAPLVDSDGTSVAVGDYISPAAVNLDAYGATFLKLMGALGAGENTTPSGGDIPRRLRHPFISDGAQIGITGKFLASFMRAHSEIEDAEFSYLPTPSPTVPSNLAAAPRVLIPRHFSILVMP